METQCVMCGEYLNRARWDLGYRTCLWCGEDEARQERHTIVPMHKSNYVPIFNKADLEGINNKGGLVK